MTEVIKNAIFRMNDRQAGNGQTRITHFIVSKMALRNWRRMSTETIGVVRKIW